MKPMIILIVLIASWNLTLGQPVNTQLITEAENAYNQGNYQEAIDIYQGILDSGYFSPELYYNMGNASFKAGNIPNAILYFEKALKLDPGNKDIQFNLNIANSRIVDKIENVPELFYVEWWKAARNLLTPNAWAWLTVVLFTLIFVMAISFMISRSVSVRRTSFWAGIIFIILFLFGMLFSWQEYKEFHNREHAIIFTPTVTVKSSPSGNSVDLFVIHEGTKVRIIDQVEGWYEIRIANGSEGWLPASAMELI